MRKGIQVISRNFSNVPVEKQKIITKSFEYEPFKFGMERQAMIHGYTMEEMYGRFYGLKHSPAMKKELNKDNVIASLIIFFGVGMAIFYNHRGCQDYNDWLKYYYSDMFYQRKEQN